MLTRSRSNMLLSLPNHIVSDVISILIDSPSDLNNLSQTCQTLNMIVNHTRYNRIILIDDKNHLSNHKRSSSYSLLHFNNFPKFLNSITKNANLLNFIHNFIILTHSNPQDLYAPDNTLMVTELLKVLYTSVNLQKVEILDNNYHKIFNNNLKEIGQLSNDISYDFNNEYEADHLIDNKINKVLKLNNLKQLHMDNFVDLKNLNLNSIESLKISMEPVYNMFGSTFEDLYLDTSNSCRIFENLNELYLNSPTSTVYFQNHLKFPTGFQLNLKTLSITNTHTFKSFGYEKTKTKLEFSKFNELINLSNLQELELKLNCDNQFCYDCIVNFFNDWYVYNLENGLTWNNITKLSIINYKNNTFNQWAKVIELYIPFFKNLKEFYINLDDFTYLPFLSIKPNNNLNSELFELRQKLFMTIPKLDKLEKLTVPDFFHNWLIYSNPIENLNFLNILNRCDCSSCQLTRLNFNRFASIDASNDFDHSFAYDDEIKRADIANINEIESTSLTDCYSNYRLSNFILIELKKRIPLRNIATVDSLLDLTKIPINKNNFIDREATDLISSSFNSFVKLILHNIINYEINFLVKSLDNLKSICLGGIYFNIFRKYIDDVKVLKFIAVYDGFEYECVV